MPFVILIFRLAWPEKYCGIPQFKLRFAWNRAILAQPKKLYMVVPAWSPTSFLLMKCRGCVSVTINLLSYSKGGIFERQKARKGKTWPFSPLFCALTFGHPLFPKSH